MDIKLKARRLKIDGDSQEIIDVSIEDVCTHLYYLKDILYKMSIARWQMEGNCMDVMLAQPVISSCESIIREMKEIKKCKDGNCQYCKSNSGLR